MPGSALVPDSPGSLWNWGHVYPELDAPAGEDQLHAKTPAHMVTTAHTMRTLGKLSVFMFAPSSHASDYDSSTKPTVRAIMSTYLRERSVVHKENASAFPSHGPVNEGTTVARRVTAPRRRGGADRRVLIRKWAGGVLPHRDPETTVFEHVEYVNIRGDPHDHDSTPDGSYRFRLPAAAGRRQRRALLAPGKLLGFRPAPSGPFAGAAPALFQQHADLRDREGCRPPRRTRRCQTPTM